jgi:hypothetical protein
MHESFDKFVNALFIIGIITIIVLKIVGVITISWIWLLFPIWGLFLLALAAAIIITLWCLISNYFYNKEKNK